MERSKIIVYSLIHALCILAYVLVLASFVDYAESLFLAMPSPLQTLPFLLILVFSAAINGLLVFGRPLHLYFSGFKKEGIQFLLYTLGFLLIIIVLMFAWFTMSNPYAADSGLRYY